MGRAFFQILKISFAIFSMFVMTNTYGQNNKEIDSLISLSNETLDLSKKIEVYARLSRKYHNVNLKEAKDYALKGISLSNQIDLSNFNGELYRSLGDIAIKQDSMNLAEQYYLTAYEYFKEQDKQRDQVMVMNVLGNIEYMRNKYSQAMDYYLEAVKLTEKNSFNEFLGHLYHNIAGINVDFQNNYTDAIKNFSVALELFKSNGDSVNMASVYHSLGSTYQKMGDTIQSLNYYYEAKEFDIKNNNTDGIAETNFGIAGIKSLSGAYKESNNYLYDAIKLFTKSNNHYAPPPSTGVSKCYEALARNYYQLNNIDSSLYYFKEAYKIAKQNNQISLIASTSKGIAKIWDFKSKTDSAYFYYKIFKTYSDSLLNKENIKKLAFQDAQFKYEKKLNEEHQRQLRENEKERLNYIILIVVIGALVLVIIIMFLLLKLWKNKVKRSHLEQKALKSELETRNKELTTHVMYQVRKNEFTLSIIKKLQSNIYKLKTENRGLIENIIKDLERDSSNSSWEDFEVRFHRVHADFSKKLLKKYPDLTSNELRLCAFLRLNMNTKEISAITYQSVNSIDTARSRLRQKLGLEKDENLTGFLIQF